MVINSTRPPPPTFVMKLLASLPHPHYHTPSYLHLITTSPLPPHPHTHPSHRYTSLPHPSTSLPYPPTHILPHTLTAYVPILPHTHIQHTSSPTHAHTSQLNIHTLTRPHHSGVFLRCKVLIIQPPLQHLISLILLITVQ